MIERRSILKGLVGLVAAPAIIKVAGIMPVKALLQPNRISMRLITNYDVTDQDISRLDVLYGQMRIQMWNDLFWQDVNCAA